MGDRHSLPTRGADKKIKHGKGKENKMKARVKYYTDYNGKEGYAVEIRTDEGWGLDTFYPLVRREGANEEEEKNFVHFGIINKIAELEILGYSVTFM